MTQTGTEEARKLYEIAREAYYDRKTLKEETKETEESEDDTNTDGNHVTCTLEIPLG